jgi:hypothetical protein
MPAVKFIERLDLEQNCSFLDRPHYQLQSLSTGAAGRQMAIYTRNPVGIL